MTTAAPSGLPYPLASVQDTDCLRSMTPLVLGRMPGKYVFGPDAILRRVLYAWLLPANGLVYDSTFGESILTIEGATLSPKQIRGLRGRLEAAARAEDYVSAASCPVALVSGELQLPGAITLVDGRTYALELLLSSAGAALDALGTSP